MERAILDACVLWPSLQRDFLLQLAEERGFEAAWSKEGLDEVHRNERKKLVRRDGLPREKAKDRADKLIGNMRGGFARAEITGYEHREGGYGLPDPKDEHVVAAAEQAGIRTIVTENAKDFPADRLPKGIEIVSARDFAARVVGENRPQALRAVEQIAARSGRQGPKMSVSDVIDQLEQRYKMTEVADVLRQARGSQRASVSFAQPPAERGGPQQQPERRRRGPRPPRLRGGRTEQRERHQERGRGGPEDPRTR